jgi:hypothetical protein
MSQIIPLIEAGAVKAVIERTLNKALNKFLKETTGIIESGIKYPWTASHAKNVVYFEKRLEGYDIPPKIKDALFKPHTNPMDAFIQREQNGLSLSDRVWQDGKRFKKNIEWSIDLGVAEGKSAKQIGRELRSNLNRPDTLFRRIRNVKENLMLSKAAADFHPGQGVYRSAAKNSERLARMEINMGYRDVDGAAYENNPLVLGYEIKLSATAKPKTRSELCVAMVGTYPAWYVWNGFHPSCLCFKIPMLMSDDLMAKYQRLVARGEDTPDAVKELQKEMRLEDLPDKAIKWINDNNERMLGWKNLPYFYKDNKRFIVGKVLY